MDALGKKSLRIVASLPQVGRLLQLSGGLEGRQDQAGQGQAPAPGSTGTPGKAASRYDGRAHLK